MNFGSILAFLVLCALCDAWRFKTHWKQLQKSAAVGLLTMAPFLHGNPAQAARDVASISTSGIIFKDTLKVSAFEDPKVSGVALYISDFERPLTEKLAKDFFNDPSSSSLTCVRTGPMTFKSDISTSSEGEEVFEESRNLFFKVILHCGATSHDMYSLITSPHHCSKFAFVASLIKTQKLWFMLPTTLGWIRAATRTKHASNHLCVPFILIECFLNLLPRNTRHIILRV